MMYSAFCRYYGCLLPNSVYFTYFVPPVYFFPQFSAGVIMDVSVAEYIVRGIDAHLDHQELCLHGIHALQYLAQDIGAIQVGSQNR